jgi:hypothetical protein
MCANNKQCRPLLRGTPTYPMTLTVTMTGRRFPTAMFSPFRASTVSHHDSDCLTQSPERRNDGGTTAGGYCCGREASRKRLLTRTHARTVDYRIPHRPTFRIPRKHGKKRHSVIVFAKGVLAAKMRSNTREFQVFRAVEGVSDNDEVPSSNLGAPIAGEGETW